MAVPTNDSGAAAVEMALILPFLLLLLCGIIDFGRAYNAKLTLTHAAREGVRVWALTEDADRASEAARKAAVGLEDPRNVDNNPGNDVTPRVVVPTPSMCNFGDSTSLITEFSFSYITPISGLIEIISGGANEFTSPLTLQATGVMRCAG